jgi:hypothetical protein
VKGDFSAEVINEERDSLVKVRHGVGAMVDCP